MRRGEPDSVADTKVINTFTEWHPVFWKDGLRQMIVEIRKQIGNSGM